MSRILLDVGGIGKNQVKFILHRINTKIGVDDFNAIFKVVKPYISPGLLGQGLLDLQSCQAGERLDAQEERYNPVSCPQLQDFVRFLCLDEVCQKRSIEGESISLLFLEDTDASMVEGVESFVFTFQLVV